MSPQYRGKRQPPVLKVFLLAIFLAHAFGIILFVHGFLLTRIHLKDRSILEDTVCQKPYEKLVWVVIDALRYDFVVKDGRYPCTSGSCDYKNHMPFLSSLVNASDSAIAFRYIADAPTTTTQRLKSMTSGGMPTFFDVSSAFSATEMDEDNMIDQFKDNGKKLIFMGDSTWDSLFPTQFTPSHHFPCYNILDLHSVDDGIQQHLLPTLKDSSSWDVLVVHYLGADHAGHAHGVESKAMADKLEQLDGSIQEMVDKMVSGAYPGGPFEGTLVVIAGDHGQTLTGDHGGGSPEEVDSAFIALDISRHHRLSDVSDMGPLSAFEINSCRLNCSCGPDKNQCVSDLTQIDAVPTLSVLFNLPIPFVNLGKLSRELWSLGSYRCSKGNGRESSTLAALKANAKQVYSYLSTYAAKPGSRFSKSLLHSLQDTYERTRNSSSSEDYLEFLEYAENSAREAWTQFHEAWMVLGALVFTFAVFFHALILLNYFSVMKEGYLLPSVLTWGINLVHPIGIFSFFYLLSEGKNVSILIYILSVTVPLFFLVYRRQHEGAVHQVVQIFSFALCAVLSCATLTWMGLQNHSGFGFWQRLTVHEPIEGVDVPPKKGQVWMVLPVFDQILESIGIQAWSTISHITKYILPSIALIHISASSYKKFPSKYGVFRSFVTWGYLSMMTYHSVIFAVDAGWMPKGFSLEALVSYVLGSTVWSNNSLPSWIRGVIHLPLSSFAPRISIIICTTSFIFLGVDSVLSRIRKEQAYSNQAAVGHTLCTTAALLCQVLSPVATPLIFLLLFIQMYSIGRMISLYKPSSLGRAILASGVVAAVQSQAFFITGHLCEFAGLLYTAAFVGFEDFNLFRSGALLAFDTFGAMIAVTCGLAIMIWNLCKPSQSYSSTAPSSWLGSSRMQMVAGFVADSSIATSPLNVALSIFGLVRAASCLTAMLSAGLQRRHLYAWALFAPKFVFEVFFVLITDLILLFMVILFDL